MSLAPIKSVEGSHLLLHLALNVWVFRQVEQQVGAQVQQPVLLLAHSQQTPLFVTAVPEASLAAAAVSVTPSS